jgi:hypothetical protein
MVQLLHKNTVKEGVIIITVENEWDNECRIKVYWKCDCMKKVVHKCSKSFNWFAHILTNLICV